MQNFYYLKAVKNVLKISNIKKVIRFENFGKSVKIYSFLQILFIILYTFPRLQKPKIFDIRQTTQLLICDLLWPQTCIRLTLPWRFQSTLAYQKSIDNAIVRFPISLAHSRTNLSAYDRFIYILPVNALKIHVVSFIPNLYTMYDV
jgi:hypothetical protein